MTDPDEERGAASLSGQMASTGEAPYYAVIFTSLRTDGDNGYSGTAERMEELARRQDGFLGIESARNEIGITVSYWRDLDSIARWKREIEHSEAQRHGREQWYARYHVRIARVERAYSWSRAGGYAVSAQPSG